MIFAMNNNFIDKSNSKKQYGKSDMHITVEVL